MAISFVSRQGGVPVALTSPQRYTTLGTQNHAAGNLLVVGICQALGASPKVTAVTNLALDTFVPTALSPYTLGNRTLNLWYCLASHGALNDIITIGAMPADWNSTNVGVTVYEFGPASVTTPFQYIGDQAAFSNAGSNTIATANLTITQASAVVALYTNSNATVPTGQNGVQTQMPTTGPDNVAVHYDSYQLTAAVGTAHFTAPGGGQPNLSILAAVFLGGGGVVAGPPCTQIT